MLLFSSRRPPTQTNASRSPGLGNRRAVFILACLFVHGAVNSASILLNIELTAVAAGFGSALSDSRRGEGIVS
jgi:hypothetical protein